MLRWNQTVTTRVLRKAGKKCYGKVPWSRGIQLHLSSRHFERWTCTCCTEQKKLWDTGKNINNSIQWAFYVSEHNLRGNSWMFWIMYSSEIFRNSNNYLWSACEDNSGLSTVLKMSFFLSSTPRYLTSQKVYQKNYYISATGKQMLFRAEVVSHTLLAFIRAGFQGVF